MRLGYQTRARAGVRMRVETHKAAVRTYFAAVDHAAQGFGA
jgi:hypothetical protein